MTPGPKEKPRHIGGAKVIPGAPLLTGATQISQSVWRAASEQSVMLRSVAEPATTHGAPGAARERIVEIHQGLCAQAGYSNEHKVGSSDVATIYLAQSDVDYWALSADEKAANLQSSRGDIIQLARFNAAPTGACCPASSHIDLVPSAAALGAHHAAS
jgi:hypothetical protein